MTKPYGYGHPHDTVAGLKLIQYRSYQRVISIYHLRTDVLPLQYVRTALQTQEQFVNRLTSFDALNSTETIEGDEVPAESIEAMYLPSIFHDYGSALALRSHDTPGRVDWFVFHSAIDQLVLHRLVCINGGWALASDQLPDDTRKVFDLVGYCEKGLATRTVRGANPEHKGWHNSLRQAEERQQILKLTWKGFVTELKAEHERERSKVNRSTEEEHNGGRSAEEDMMAQGSLRVAKSNGIDKPLAKDKMLPLEKPKRPLVRHKGKK
ncbi:hypothetical protein N0V94_000151 [Neodidymelliopsis sp. IMI 364377]|nr:hypothetical protein N0V94_000151 [Neodidymelliopsis sp. IMI 364377]